MVVEYEPIFVLMVLTEPQGVNFRWNIIRCKWRHQPVCDSAHLMEVNWTHSAPEPERKGQPRKLNPAKRWVAMFGFPLNPPPKRTLQTKPRPNRFYCSETPLLPVLCYNCQPYSGLLVKPSQRPNDSSRKTFTTKPRSNKRTGCGMFNLLSKLVVTVV